MNTCEAILPSSRIAANKRSAACDLDGEMVILNLDSGVYFGLNAVAASIWHCVQSERQMTEIIEHLMAEYNVSRAQCESEVVALLQNMANYGLVDVHSNGEAA